MQRTYIMSDSVYRRLLKLRNAERILCERCGKEIKPGQKVMAKLSVNGRTKYYHLDCWNACFIEI